jgi:hypothetical protein
MAGHQVLLQIYRNHFFAIWGPNGFSQNPYKSVRTRSINAIIFAILGPNGLLPNPHKSVCTRSLNAIVFTIWGRTDLGQILTNQFAAILSALGQ